METMEIALLRNDSLGGISLLPESFVRHTITSMSPGGSMWKFVRIKSFEVGLYFENGEFRRLLRPGRHAIFNPLWNRWVTIVSRRAPWLEHEQLDVIWKSGQLENDAILLDIKDHERALVWIDGRFHSILGSGRYVYWTGARDVQTEIVDARNTAFEHEQLPYIVSSPPASKFLEIVTVNRHHVGALFVDGRWNGILEPGKYAYWKGMSDVRVVAVDLRETIIDIGGQEIMTLDKVTLRMNALVTYKVVDPRVALSESEDVRQALYRDTQLTLRAVVGSKELDHFLTEKDAVCNEIETDIRERAKKLGLEIAAVGIRDIILPGDMKELMNKVTEAKKAAEANLIARREETAAIRSQANTAKLLAENPTLMRLRELEVLEKIAANGNLKVMVGEKGLADRVLNLL
jgi:regulator of protease activity HflC (stomatin/prohibitin superfamily)